MGGSISYRSLLRGDQKCPIVVKRIVFSFEGRMCLHSNTSSLPVSGAIGKWALTVGCSFGRGSGCFKVIQSRNKARFQSIGGVRLVPARAKPTLQTLLAKAFARPVARFGHAIGINDQTGCRRQYHTAFRE